MTPELSSIVFNAEIEACIAHKKLIQANAPGARNVDQEIAVKGAIHRLRRALEFLENYPQKTSGEIADMLEAAE